MQEHYRPGTDGAGQGDDADVVAERDRNGLGVNAEIGRLAAQTGTLLLLLLLRR